MVRKSCWFAQPRAAWPEACSAVLGFGGFDGTAESWSRRFMTIWVGEERCELPSRSRADARRGGEHRSRYSACTFRAARRWARHDAGSLRSARADEARPGTFWERGSLQGREGPGPKPG